MDESASSDRRSNSLARWLLAAVAILIVGALLFEFVPGRRDHRLLAPASPSLPASRYRNTSLSVAYVGDEACARCHAEIARDFREHPMGRSMTTAAGATSEVNGVVFEVADLVYSVLQHDGHVFHRESRRAGNDPEASMTEAEVKYVLGSGTRGQSFLVERAGGLYQSPIGWYAREPHWGLSPRYEIHNLHFDRPITKGCLFCHANRFELVAGQAPVFHGLAIGCERCHGPGELHVRQPELVDGVDLTIVNPADLEPPALRESVCEQCHLQGFSRTSPPGRSQFDYRPGLPLEDFLTVSFGRGDPVAALRSVGHVEQMRLSRCYEQSGGALGCISCHDPHRRPKPEERVAHYRDRCLRCHAKLPCSLARDERLARNPADDCTGCHMPRSRTTVDIAHTSTTLHTVPRADRAKP
jgi:predicted CXXCH cytochrome family protein